MEDVTTDTSPSSSITESSPNPNPTSSDDRDGDGNTDDDIKNSKSATLTFRGNCTYLSKPLPIPSHHHNPSSLIDFFSDESHQNILLSGANKKESITNNNNDSQKDATDESFVEYIRDRELYNSFIDTWMKQSHHMHGKTYRPNYDEDSIAIVQPDGIPMAGITVYPTSIVGSKLFINNDDNDTKSAGIPTTTTIPMPEFQVLLLEDKPRAKGPKFMVWLFNKLTYGGSPPPLLSPQPKRQEQSQNDNHDNNDTTNNQSPNQHNKRRHQSALLRVWAEPCPHNSTQFVQIRAESKMCIELSFPELLLRLFPMKREVAEDICSEAVQNVLEQSTLPAVKQFCSLYEEWMDKRS